LIQLKEPEYYEF